MIEIHHPRRGLAGGFLGTSTGEKGPVEDGHLHFPGVIGNGDREEAGILVVHVDEINAVIRIQRSPAPVASSETNPPIWPRQSVGLWGESAV